MSRIITQDIDKVVDEFKTQHGLHHIIAFAGGASSELPGIDSKDPLSQQFAHVQQERDTRLAQSTLDILRHYRIAILSGGTRFGFPKTAVDVALSFKLKTIGVFPKTAHDKNYVLPNLDLSICVEPHYGDSAWGDESSVFAKLLDAVIVVGGNAGTLIEVAHLLKMNESRHKYNQPLKLIIPIFGTGGVADGLPFVWGKQEIKNACMPPTPIQSGLEAAKYIETHLDLYNV